MKDREKNFIFDGPFKEYCPMYVEYKRNLGYKFGESSLYQLRYMDDFFKNYDMALLRLNKDMVEDYVSKRGNESTKTQHMRMSLIRQFSIFMNSLGFNFYVHPKELIPIIKTFTPYIFTHKEIASIIKVLDSLDYTPCSKHYHLIYPMLFRMLYGCGLRINEALSLKKIDVDLVNGILTVKKAKNNTSRLVPMSTSLQNYCRQYASNMGFEMHDNGYFYPSRDNGKYNNTPVYVKFKHFMKKAGIFTDNETARKSSAGLNIAGYGVDGTMISNNAEYMRIQLIVRTENGTQTMPIDAYTADFVISDTPTGNQVKARPAIFGINLGLMVRSTDKAGSKYGAQTYQVLDKVITAPDDGYIRNAYLTTIALRNGGLGEVIK